MYPNEFDKALRDRYESGSLPPDLAQWEKLVERLDIHETAAPPAPKPRRGIIAFWPVWAAAASILLIGWLFLQESEAPMLAQQKATGGAGLQVQPTIPAAVTPTGQDAAGSTAPVPGAPTPQRQRSLIAGSKPAGAHPGTTRSQSILVNTQPSPAAAIAAATTAPAAAPSGVAPLPQTADRVEPRYESLNFAARDLPAGAGFDDGEETVTREHRGFGFDVNGGFGPGSLKRNYALGVTVNRKLSERLRVEAGVAVVSGTFESFNSAMASAFTPGVAELPSNTSTQLTYIQAAPALTYELRSGLFGGAGVDAQRLISNSGQATGYAYSGEKLEAQPAWDFGYTVRAGYRVSRRIKAGMQYRNSMHTTAPVGGTSVQPRNYLLFQLGYVIQ